MATLANERDPPLSPDMGSIIEPGCRRAARLDQPRISAGKQSIAGDAPVQPRPVPPARWRLIRRIPGRP
jgi:hypothetical protein